MSSMARWAEISGSRMVRMKGQSHDLGIGRLGTCSRGGLSRRGKVFDLGPGASRRGVADHRGGSFPSYYCRIDSAQIGLRSVECQFARPALSALAGVRLWLVQETAKNGQPRCMGFLGDFGGVELM